MTFQQNLARVVTGDITTHSIPSIAFDALEEGLDSPSLRILAGLPENENGFVIDQYFKDALSELSLPLPNLRQAAIEVGLALAEEIFNGRKTVFEGVREIRRKAIDAYPFFEETKDYCYDSIGFEKAYGIYVTIDELREAGPVQWEEHKSNQQLEEELNEQLLTELKEWSYRLKTAANMDLTKA